MDHYKDYQKAKEFFEKVIRCRYDLGYVPMAKEELKKIEKILKEKSQNNP